MFQVALFSGHTVHFLKQKKTVSDAADTDVQHCTVYTHQGQLLRRKKRLFQKRCSPRDREITFQVFFLGISPYCPSSFKREKRFRATPVSPRSKCKGGGRALQRTAWRTSTSVQCNPHPYNQVVVQSKSSSIDKTPTQDGEEQEEQEDVRHDFCLSLSLSPPPLSFHYVTTELAAAGKGERNCLGDTGFFF